ncbi:otospiralin-like [Bombina bombina]|uniref:otospiralin-like n=1 Tax=Bombina bombina TaxID=8345 RepID=UPI00235AB6A8|nr:otospiralin-like [Bombina bombina]
MAKEISSMRLLLDNPGIQILFDLSLKIVKCLTGIQLPTLYNFEKIKHLLQHSYFGTMKHLRVLLVLGTSIVFLASLGATAAIPEKAAIREKRAMPNWSMSASDFYGWVEELRKLGAYDKTEDMARIYWAHFPIASQLGYDVTDYDD